MSHRFRRMKIILLVVGIFLFFTSEAWAAENTSAEPTRVLFIGNSYVYVNDLPRIFERLSESGGHPVEVAMAAPGGWTLLQHAQSAQTTAALNQRPWDYVVLQEQSVRPALPSGRAQMAQGARQLNRLIQGRGAKTVFLMTWGRRDGFPETGFKDFAQMQAQLYRGYMDIARELKAMVAPVGVAWQDVVTGGAQISLWQGDGSHPSVEGSYLSACVLYSTVFQQSPEQIEYTAGLSKRQAAFLRKTAAAVVLDNAAKWSP